MKSHQLRTDEERVVPSLNPVCSRPLLTEKLELYMILQVEICTQVFRRLPSLS